MDTALSPGTKAADFDLHATPDQKVSLKDFSGRPLVLLFYPADWSPVCGDELAIFNQLLPTFHARETQIVGISVDSPWSHNAYATAHNIHFPLLSDFEPKGSVAKSYGVYSESDGVCQRAIFVIDRDSTVQWSYVSPLGVNPGADGVLDALNSLEKAA